MTTALTIVTALLLLVGAGFGLIGALGVLRFPDVFTRMHAASKAGTLGSGFCLLAVAVHDSSFDVSTPLRSSMSSSASRTRGSTTTPLPMTGVMWS